MEKLKQHTDQELVKMYISGINEAFDTLLSRYQDRLYTYIYYSVHDTETADDIFQDTFLKVISTLQQGRYTENGKFYPWLVRIAHNLVIDHFRASANAPVMLSDDDGGNHAAAGQADVSAEAAAEHEEAIESLCRLVEFLPEAQQEIVRMRFYQDMTFKEIADTKQMSINTALGRMRYAILNMRRMANERHIHPA